MQDNNFKKLNILIFYDDYACSTTAVREHLSSFKEYSKHNVFFAIGTKGAVCYNNISFADVIIIHYSVRLSLRQYISAYVAKEIADFKGLKILFLQDEYENTYQTHAWIKQLEINIVFTCVPPDFIDKVYPKKLFPNVTFVNNLTGYVPENIPNLKIIPAEQRKNLIVYRGRKLGFWYGSLGQEKYEIGIKMKKICQDLKIPEDIECKDEKRIYGPAWYDFLLSGRAMLGTESGANIFDWDGTLKNSITDYLEKNKNVNYKKIANLFLQDDNQILMNQISPKIFQSIICRTALVLYEGEYSKIISPGKHYIPLRKDWKNIKEVIDSIKNLSFINKLTENAYNDIIKSGKYSYQSFIKKVEKVIDNYHITPKQINVISTPVLMQNNNKISTILNKNFYILSDFILDREQLDNLRKSTMNLFEININKSVKVTNSTQAITGYEFKKILDDNPHDFYAAAICELPLPHFIEFNLSLPIGSITKIEVLWLDSENFASEYNIEYWDNEINKYVELHHYINNLVEFNSIEVNNNNILTTKIRLIVHKTIGQPRLLIRNIKFFSTLNKMNKLLPDNNNKKNQGLICPDCKSVIYNLACTKCNWKSNSNIADKILNFIGKKDLEDPIFNLYLQNYDQICSDDLENSILPSKYLRNQAINIVKYIGDIQNKKICEVGSGQGFLINTLLKAGANDITAVDICDQYLNNLPNSVRCIKANAENLPFAEEFDIIIATDILEHVFNVGSFLYCVHKALKPGGVVYIRVPYKENLMSYSPHLGCPYRFVHLRTFDELLLKQSLTESGFNPLKLYHDGFWLHSPNKFWSHNNFLNSFYEKTIVPCLLNFIKEKEDITLLSSRFCKLFLRPYELLIKAEKNNTNL